MYMSDHMKTLFQNDGNNNDNETDGGQSPRWRLIQLPASTPSARHLL